METDDRLDAIFFALADRRRRRLLSLLVAGPKTVNQLAALAGMKLSATSKHLAALAVANLLHKTREGRKIFCHLNFDVWREVSHYIAMQESFWTGRLDELEAHFKSHSELGK